jgi:AcrR family transcriptional regulator
MTDERRRQILVGIFHAVVKSGYANCTITEISEAANLSRGILHYYFKSKKEMLLELMTSLGNVHYDGLVRIIEETEDVREKLKSIVRFQYMDESKPFHDTAGVWVEFWGQVPHDPEVREVIRTIQTRLRDLISGLIESGMEQGVFRPVDPRNTASVIMSMMEGPTLQWNVDHKSVNIREVSGTLEDFIACYLENPCPRH